MPKGFLFLRVKKGMLASSFIPFTLYEGIGKGKVTSKEKIFKLVGADVRIGPLHMGKIRGDVGIAPYIVNPHPI